LISSSLPRRFGLTSACRFRRAASSKSGGAVRGWLIALFVVLALALLGGVVFLGWRWWRNRSRAGPDFMRLATEDFADEFQATELSTN
jgi:hypothetical protein